MAVTIDPRPTYFGDRMIVTGSYEATDALIDLRSLLASIDMAVVTPALSAQQEVGDSANTGIERLNMFDQAIVVDPSDARISIENGQASAATTGGNFIAIGRRS